MRKLRTLYRKLTRAPYQDIWRNGRLVRRGRRECASRYEVLHAGLRELLEPGFTVADIGGWDGYFCRRLVEDLAGAATNVDRRAEPPDLPDQVRHLQLEVTADTVGVIGYHDAILALSVLHHLPDWQQVYVHLRDMCQWLLVETASPDEAGGYRLARIAGALAAVGPCYEQVSADATRMLGYGSGPGGYPRPVFLVQGR